MCITGTLRDQWKSETRVPSNGNIHTQQLLIFSIYVPSRLRKSHHILWSPSHADEYILPASICGQKGCNVMNDHDEQGLTLPIVVIVFSLTMKHVMGEQQRWIYQFWRRLNPGWTLDEPWMNPGWAPDEPWMNPGWTLDEPWMNPGWTYMNPA